MNIYIGEHNKNLKKWEKDREKKGKGKSIIAI